jgi:dephospho-CoA kinase
MIIGLTGTCCTGKNYVARILNEKGLPVLDVDKQGHEALEAEKDAVCARFGKDILNADGTVNRKLLGEKVFGKPAELAVLENIVHPAVNRMTSRWIEAQNHKPCVINAALLHRSTTFQSLDAVILVEAPFFTRLLRARGRDHLPWVVLLKRFRSQKEFKSQYLSGDTDIYKVENRGYFSFGAAKRRAGLENRIDVILSRLGIQESGSRIRHSGTVS